MGTWVPAPALLGAQGCWGAGPLGVREEGQAGLQLTGPFFHPSSLATPERLRDTMAGHPLPPVLLLLLLASGLGSAAQGECEVGRHPH